MRNKELFLRALNTMLYSWGGDPPPEVHWALDEFRQFYEAETGHQLDLPEYDEEGDWAAAVISAIENDGDDTSEIETHQHQVGISRAISFFYSNRDVEDLIESTLEDDNLGDASGIFTKEEFIDWALGHSGDNDYDYELGRFGWVEIENNIEQLAQLYLNDLNEREFDEDIEDVLFNVKNSLEDIVGNNSQEENEHPDDMGPDDRGLQEEIKRIKKLL